jgi:hypothetical protein
MSGIPDRKTLVFVGGLHRSGTSLMHEALRAHPEISGFQNTGVPEDEGQHLQTLYPPAMAFGGPGRFGFDDRAYMDETHPLSSPTTARALMNQWRPYWDAGKNTLVEKSPTNLVRTRFLQSLFPDARFVMIMRHPLAVSYATRKWTKATIEQLIQHWLVCHERFTADLAYLHHVYVTTYEQLVDDPEQIFDGVCAFVGVERIPFTATVRRGMNDRYFREWDRDAQGVMALRYEERVRTLGYSLLAPHEARRPTFLA